MNFISLWAGRIEPYNKLPEHLGVLYKSIGHSCFQRAPEVCSERELVPVAELLEPFLHSAMLLDEARTVAEQKGLHLANTVVSVYTNKAPKTEAMEPAGCDLRFVGTFPDA
jgi:hypothetical protein